MKRKRVLKRNYPCGLANRFWLGDGMTVPVEEAEEAEDESSSVVCSGSSGTWSASSSSISSKISAGRALRRFFAQAFWRSLMAIVDTASFRP